MIRIIGYVFVLLVGLSLATQKATAMTFVAEKQNNWQGVERIVALGDVHGDFDQFARVLRDAGLINQRNQWIGGKAHFVQTGDIPDRGPETGKIITLLMGLEKQAKKAGGRVHALIGNHEAMNTGGDLRYVTKKEFKAFTDKKSKKRRKAYYKQYVQYVNDKTVKENWPVFDDEYKEKWQDNFPLGWVEHRNNWGEGGLFGKWIASHNAIIIVNDTMFLHGGISPKFATTSLDSMNSDIRADVFSYLGITHDPEGPLWYRGLAKEEEFLLEGHLEQVLAHHKIKRIVVGHSRTRGAIRPRFGARVLMIDVGLGEHYGSNFAYLEIDQGKPRAIHRGEPLIIPTEGGQPYIDYLEKAAALDAEALAPLPSPLEKRIAKQKQELLEKDKSDGGM